MQSAATAKDGWPTCVPAKNLPRNTDVELVDFRRFKQYTVRTKTMIIN